jgi:putative RecB family exonuclease
MSYSLSATKLVTYKQCPQAYSFRYERGISAPGAFGSPDLGNALHLALAMAYRDWHYNDHKPELKWFEDCWSLCLAKLSDKQILDGHSMIEDYFKDFVAPLGVMPRPLGVEGKIKATIQFENIEFALNCRYDRLDNLDCELELNDYKSTKFAYKPDSIDVQLGVYLIGLDQIYQQSLRRMNLIFLRSREKLSFEVNGEHREKVQELISGLALRLRNDSEWEPSPGEHCKRCTYQKHCGAVCAEPEPLPEGERKLKQVQLALAV